jgi:hypothetical protein
MATAYKIWTEVIPSQGAVRISISLQPHQVMELSFYIVIFKIVPRLKQKACGWCVNEHVAYMGKSHVRGAFSPYDDAERPYVGLVRDDRLVKALRSHVLRGAG